MKTARKKLHPIARISLEQGELIGPQNVLVRVVEEPTAVDLEEMLARGLTLRSRAGFILSGSIDASRLLDLATLPIVGDVEVSRPLYLE